MPAHERDGRGQLQRNVSIFLVAPKTADCGAPPRCATSRWLKYPVTSFPLVRRRYPTTDANGLLLSFEDTWTTQLLCSLQVQPSCLLWVADRQTYDSTACTPINWTATNTTCACGVAAFEAAAAGGGSFTSGSEAMLGSFAALFDPSAFGPNLFLSNLLLMYTFGVILVLVLINCWAGCSNDARDNAASWTELEAAKAREAHDDHEHDGGGAIHDLRASTGVESDVIKKEIEAKRTMAGYAERSLPEVRRRRRAAVVGVS